MVRIRQQRFAVAPCNDISMSWGGSEKNRHYMVLLQTFPYLIQLPNGDASIWFLEPLKLCSNPIQRLTCENFILKGGQVSNISTKILRKRMIRN